MLKIYETQIKNYLKYLFARLRKKKFILSRCACLGRDVLEGVDGIIFDNFKKHRIDQHLTTLDVKQIQDVFDQSQIFDMVKKQEISLFDLKCKPDYIVIDTYSELVDKKFTLKENHFFCVASDMKEQIRQGLQEGTLIPQEHIEKKYLSYFTMLKQRFSCPIIAILFPSHLDARDFYKERFEFISKSLANIEKGTNLIQTIRLSYDEYVGADQFPYHFNEDTKNKIRSKLLNTINV